MTRLKLLPVKHQSNDTFLPAARRDPGRCHNLLTYFSLLEPFSAKDTVREKLATYGKGRVCMRVLKRRHKEPAAASRTHQQARAVASSRLWDYGVGSFLGGPSRGCPPPSPHIPSKKVTTIL